MAERLRFAPLIRVSTEAQSQKGESLRTQAAQIREFVHSLGGTIPEYCWAYSGQEHATPDQERKKLEALLTDAARGKFDAVIVADNSRWSRDNRRSKEGLEVLRDNNIRFFVGTMEYDLYNPEHILMLGMAAEFNEFQARQQAFKSITNRIQRARRGVPANGSLPYGRTFDRRTETWGLDPEKQQKIQWAAERYLAGESIPRIAQTLGLHHTSLWKILTTRSGPTWSLRFRSEKANIDETVEISVPPLLSPETIQAVMEQGEANRTYYRREIKHRYLLNRMIFCGHCGYALEAQTTNRGYQYFRHPLHRKRHCSLQKTVPAKPVERAVLQEVYKVFGDQKRIEEAARKATPDLSEIESMQAELAEIEGQEDKATKERDNLVSMVAKGLLTEEEIEPQIGPIRERLASIQDRRSYLEAQLADQPDPEKIKKKSKLARSVLVDALKNPGPKAQAKILEAPFERQREVMERAFAGRDREGNRLGVYVTKTEDPDHSFRLEIRAVLDQVVEVLAEGSEGGGSLPRWWIKQATTNSPESNPPSTSPSFILLETLA
jgi:DNA invertase Pin-like site-specific DNA recombinase